MSLKKLVLMTENGLKQQLNHLSSIKPDRSWAVSARAELLNYIEANPVSESRQYNARTFFTPRLANIFIAGAPAPRLVFAAFSVLALGAVSMLFVGVGQDGENAPQTHISAVVESGANAQKTQGSNIAVKIVQNNKMAESQKSAEIFGGALTALKIYDDDLDVAFQASLRERINRVTVLAQDTNNAYAEELAISADKLFVKGDYDAALRIITLAESLLE